MGAVGTAATAGGLGATALRYGMQYGVPLAGGIIANRMANNAQRDSDAAMQDYYNRALDAEIEERDYRRSWDEDERGYQRQRYADFTQSIEPYRKAGTTAVDRLSQLMGQNPWSGTPRPIAQTGQQGMVRLKSPDGSSVASVPAHVAQHFISRGAQPA